MTSRRVRNTLEPDLGNASEGKQSEAFLPCSDAPSPFKSKQRSNMNANPQFLAATARVDEAAIQPLPNSRKIYVEGSRPDIRVPMREISQSDTPASFGAEPNPPVYIYDTSGPYSDPEAQIDIRSGLAPLRAAWIAERG